MMSNLELLEWAGAPEFSAKEVAFLWYGVDPAIKPIDGSPQYRKITSALKVIADHFGLPSDEVRDAALSPMTVAVWQVRNLEKGAIDLLKCIRPRAEWVSFFEHQGERPLFLFPETAADHQGDIGNSLKTEQAGLSEFERMPRLLKEAIRAWREYYDSGEAPPKKTDLIDDLQKQGYAESKAEAEAIDKIIRSDAAKRGVLNKF